MDADATRERRRLYNKKYYEKNKEFCIGLSQAYYRDNLKERRQYAKNYYLQKKYNASINANTESESPQTAQNN